MTQETALIWWWLGVLTKRRYNALKARYGTLDEALRSLDASLLAFLGIKEEAIGKTLERFQGFQPEAYRATMEQAGVGLLSLEDDLYPARLHHLPDQPLFLSYRGDLSLLKRPMVSVVGTRGMTPYGRRIVSQFVPTLVRAHVVTVSGLALGIDAEVAEETLRAGGQTIAVLGNGLSSIYPRSNAKLAERILAAGGLLLSEFRLEMEPDTYTFPARNRIIAGLGLGTLVCEAPAKSGSVITAELALEYNRDVFAVPGQIDDPNRAGCHALITDGEALMVTSPEQILHALGMLTPDPIAAPAYKPPTPMEAAIYTVLTSLPQSPDTIMEKSGRPAGDVAVCLTLLQMAGVAKPVGEGLWVRV